MELKKIWVLASVLLIVTSICTLGNEGICITKIDDLYLNFRYQLPDLVITNSGDDDVTILLGDGFGGFRDRQDYPVGDEPWGIIVEDFNEDGVFDLAVSNHGDDDVSILFGDGHARFDDRHDYPAGRSPADIVTGDYNNDKFLDLAVTNYGDGDVTILLNDGHGRFSNRHDYSSGEIPWVIVAGDFNNDGFPDLAVGNQGDRDVSVLLNDGDGGFGNRQDYADGVLPGGIIDGDFNGDGNLDIAVANYQTNEVAILFNDGHGGFYNRQNYPSGALPAGVASGDYNGDGSVDLAVANYHDVHGSVTILFNDGQGDFSDLHAYPAGRRAATIITDDFNLDENLDLAVTNTRDDNITVLLNDGRGEFDNSRDFDVGDAPLSGIRAADFNYDQNNQPPNAPNIDGQASGEAGVEYEYTFIAPDPDGDEIYYWVEWGDETNSGWIGPYASGEEVILRNIWDSRGTYIIRAQAKDEHEAESEWATLEVSMPKIYENPLLTLIEKIFDRLEQMFGREILTL